MKLVLCSEGFSTPNIIEACVRLVGKPQDQISVGIINEAYAVEKGDKRWLLDNLNTVAKTLGGEVDIVNLLALPMTEVEKRLTNKDVIFVVGGNTDYLMSVFQKTGFDKLLPKLLETKVYVGSSAGSMVIGKRISTAAYRLIYGEDDKWSVTSYLDLVDFSIMPHLDSPYFPNRKESLIEAVGSFEDKVYGLCDDSAIVVDGSDIKTIGSEPIIVEKVSYSMLDLFTYDGSNRAIKYVETMQVKDGVECDVYSFINDDSQDLAIVRVDKAASTPRQEVMKGTRTIEGIVSGAGKLTIEHTNGTNTVYAFSDEDNAPITVRIGEIMQWTASEDTDLVFYEICQPPYEDGRFENLPDRTV